MRRDEGRGPFELLADDATYFGIDRLVRCCTGVAALRDRGRGSGVRRAAGSDERGGDERGREGRASREDKRRQGRAAGAASISATIARAAAAGSGAPRIGRPTTT